jgi:hypothetical protein
MVNKSPKSRFGTEGPAQASAAEKLDSIAARLYRETKALSTGLTAEISSMSPRA